MNFVSVLPNSLMYGVWRPAVVRWKPPVATHMTARVQHSADRWDIRPGAFVVTFKETTRGGRSRAIRLDRDWPLSYRASDAIVMPLIYCGSLTTISIKPFWYFKKTRQTGYAAFKTLNTFQRRLLYCLWLTCVTVGAGVSWTTLIWALIKVKPKLQQAECRYPEGQQATLLFCRALLYF